MPDEETKNKRGPKPMPEDRRRRERVSIVVNVAELELIRAAAKASGDSVSIWGRKVLLKAAKEAQAPAPEQK
jgi:uncharacterized protein (DUF1778 family)